MRKLFCWFLIAPACAFAHPDAAYQPLAFLADHCWQGAFPGGRTDEHCFTWIYDGKFLRDRHTVRAQGMPDALGESIYFWDSAARQLEYLYIESDGGFSRGPVSIDNEALVFPDTSFVENGKTMVYRSRWQRSGATAYDVVTEFKSKDGWAPGFKVHMEQVAARKKAGYGAPGESADVLTIVPEYNDPVRFARLAHDLANRGCSNTRIDKLLGANFARLFAEVWDAP